MIIPFSSIVEANGKTVRENNLAIAHKYPIGQVVTLNLDHNYKILNHDGQEIVLKIKGEATLIVVKHSRDCDGTPLYSLCTHPVIPPDTTRFSQDRMIYEFFMGFYTDSHDEASMIPTGPIVEVRTYEEWKRALCQGFSLLNE